MARLIADRLGHLLLVLWVVTTLTFLLFRLMPGDPTLNFLSPSFTEETRAALLHSFGLDKPLWQQYLIYLGQLLHGDFGQSFLQNAPVSRILWDALPNTVVLTLVSLVPRLCVRHRCRRVPGVPPRRGSRGGGDPGRARHPRRAGILARHAAAGAVRVPAWLVPDRRRDQSRRHARLARRSGCCRAISGGTCACRR